MERAGSRLALRVSLHNEPGPPGGIVDPPFRWENVLEELFPTDAERGPAAWCAVGPEILSAGDRIETALLVRVVDSRIEVEDRICVTTRAMAPMIEAERDTVGAKLEELKATAQQRAEDAPTVMAALPYHGHAKLAGALRSITRGIATIPDRFASSTKRAVAFLSTAEGRARFRAGLLQPHGLTAEQKAVTLFAGIAGVIMILALAHFAVTLITPQFARPWRAILFLYLYAFGTSVGIPLPIEPLLIPAALAVGPSLAIGTTVAAKIVGAWMVFFLGDEIHDRLAKRAEKKPWLGRFLEWSERFAQRFGMLAVALFIAVPGLPDAVALYIFGSLHMKLWKFLVGVGVGSLVLNTIIVFGGLALFT